METVGKIIVATSFVCLAYIAFLPLFVRLFERTEYNKWMCKCGGVWRVMHIGDSRHRVTKLRCNACGKETVVCADIVTKDK